MVYRLTADAVVLLHAAFVAFVVLGGLMVARWPRLMWAHLPAAAWGALIEFAGWICPLTPIENELRHRAGMATYPGDFVEHYVLPVLYPDDLTRSIQVALGVTVVALNAAAYWRVARLRAMGARPHPPR
jgi:hypothetical protein